MLDCLPESKQINAMLIKWRVILECGIMVHALCILLKLSRSCRLNKCWPSGFGMKFSPGFDNLSSKNHSELDGR